MINLIKTFIALLLIGCYSINSIASESGYKIEVHIQGLTQSQLILAHYFGGSVYPDDTLKLDSKGHGAFIGDKSLPQGIYLVYFEDGSSFQIILGDDQQFSLKTDTTNYVDNLNA